MLPSRIFITFFILLFIGSFSIYPNLSLSQISIFFLISTTCLIPELISSIYRPKEYPNQDLKLNQSIKLIFYACMVLFLIANSIYLKGLIEFFDLSNAIKTKNQITELSNSEITNKNILTTFLYVIGLPSIFLGSLFVYKKKKFTKK